MVLDVEVLEVEEVVVMVVVTEVVPVLVKDEEDVLEDDVV